MREDRLAVLQNTFARVAVQKVEFSRVFYEHLFELEPGLERLFKNGLAAQQRKLMTALVQIIQSFGDPAQLDQYVSGLAERHLEYGAKPVDLKLFGRALMLTLESTLGDELTDEVRAVWGHAFGHVAATMTSAMEAFIAKSAEETPA